MIWAFHLLLLILSFLALWEMNKRTWQFGMNPYFNFKLWHTYRCNQNSRSNPCQGLDKHTNCALPWAASAPPLTSVQTSPVKDQHRHCLIQSLPESLPPPPHFLWEYIYQILLLFYLLYVVCIQGHFKVFMDNADHFQLHFSMNCLKLPRVFITQRLGLQ